MTAVPGEPSPLRLRSSSASRAGTYIVTSINSIGSFDFRTGGQSTSSAACRPPLSSGIPIPFAKLARITRQIDRAVVVRGEVRYGANERVHWLVVGEAGGDITKQ